MVSTQDNKILNITIDSSDYGYRRTAVDRTTFKLLNLRCGPEM